ncbi:MAG: hypothetical protein IT161_08675 [Bryobacterales bacterium]|nr:hypothetical protein [Bryobacterales bacterium]
MVRGVSLFLAWAPLFGASLDLSRAVVAVRSGADVSAAEKTAAVVLVEEVQKRTGIRLPVVTGPPPADRAAIVFEKSGAVQAEGFRIATEGAVIRIGSADGRGALYGAGHLLRQLDWEPGRLALASPVNVATAPYSRIRGHQLGYRSTANSWDAWTVAQFEQYIRELALFGINSVENIPFQDERPDPLMKVPRREMNRAMAEICMRYGLDYWVWTPADVDLSNTAKRSALLKKFDELFKDLPTLTGVFVPGGDPGDNPPELVLPLLEDIARRLAPVHPKARVWLSLQGFDGEKAEQVYRYLDRQTPAWFGGIVAGPSSPPIPETRRRLPRNVGLRLYPDLTHNKISQYEVPNWDQAYALTLGREAVNPRPYEYAAIHNRYAAMSDGFLSYSDGVHDDVNKNIWSALAWDPSRDVRDILIEYCRVFFGPAVAEQAADGLLALERNWRGPLIANGAVEAALGMWAALEQRSPRLAGNWRWQMCLLRANYDAYVRRRLIQDSKLEEEANAILAGAGTRGAASAMLAASQVLNRAVEQPAGAALRSRIVELCEQLFQSIGLQTSVPKYHASGAERGAVLDFIDNPLNNRWWLEDEFAKVKSMGSEEAKVRRLREIARWENPGPGSFYDDIGNESKSPHVVRGAGEDSDPLFWWWDQGKSRARLSWQVTLWPKEVVYEGLDSGASYAVRTTGYGQALLRIDGERITPAVDGKEMAEYKEFIVPAKHLGDGKLVLTWDRATGEESLNWRRRSRLAEVWLLKR